MPAARSSRTCRWSGAAAHRSRTNFAARSSSANVARVPLSLSGVISARHAEPVSSHVIAAGRRHSLGLCEDGTVVAAGAGKAGECRTDDWVDVIGVAAANVHTASNTGRSHSVGLRSDGTVVATGWNGDGQCEVTSWREMTAVAAGWGGRDHCGRGKRSPWSVRRRCVARRDRHRSRLPSHGRSDQEPTRPCGWRSNGRSL